MIVFLLPMFAFSEPVVIADSVSIVEVGNATGNDDNFFIYVKSGSGSCTDDINKKLIVFPLLASNNNDKIHARSYSAILAAYMSGKKVTITNYQDNGCNNASKVKIVD